MDNEHPLLCVFFDFWMLYSHFSTFTFSLLLTGTSIYHCILFTSRTLSILEGPSSILSCMFINVLMFTSTLVLVIFILSNLCHVFNMQFVLYPPPNYSLHKVLYIPYCTSQYCSTHISFHTDCFCSLSWHSTFCPMVFSFGVFHILWCFSGVCHT